MHKAFTRPAGRLEPQVARSVRGHARAVAELPQRGRARLSRRVGRGTELDSDETWAAELRGYLSSLDDPASAGFREALAQSYLRSDEDQIQACSTAVCVSAGY